MDNFQLWKRFQDRYPEATRSNFRIENFFGKKNIMFVGRDEEMAVFDDNGKEFRPSLYFSEEMKRSLGLTSSFPLALTLNPASKLVVPAVPFDKTAHPTNDMLVSHEIYVTPADKFNVKFRNIYTDTALTLYSGKEAKRWLSGPNMNLWRQQLN